MKVKFAVAVAVLFLASLARADSAPSGTLYDINGTMTLAGDSNCPSCTDTINYSFVLDVADCGVSSRACVDGTVTATSIGPLGTISSNNQVWVDHGLYVAFYNDFGTPVFDEIDMYFNIANGAPFATPGNLFTCLSPACVADFSIDKEYGFTVANEFTAVDPANVPEPSLYAMVCASFALLVFRRYVKTKVHSNG